MCSFVTILASFPSPLQLIQNATIELLFSQQSSFGISVPSTHELGLYYVLGFLIVVADLGQKIHLEIFSLTVEGFVITAKASFLSLHCPPWETHVAFKVLLKVAQTGFSFIFLMCSSNWTQQSLKLPGSTWPCPLLSLLECPSHLLWLRIAHLFPNPQVTPHRVGDLFWSPRGMSCPSPRTSAILCSNAS